MSALGRNDFPKLVLCLLYRVDVDVLCSGNGRNEKESTFTILGMSHKMMVYSGTPLQQTPLGTKILSAIARP